MISIPVLSLLSVLIALAVLVYGIYQNYSPAFVTLVAVLIVAIGSQTNIFAAYTTTYAKGVGSMATNMFLIFVTACMFGQVMDKIGAARELGNWMGKIFPKKAAIVAVVVAMAVMQYGGLGFGAFIIMYSIGLRLFKRAGITRFLLPGAIFCGSWSFAMTGPFAINAMNALLGQFFGTTPYAGLVPGLFGMAVNGVGGVIYLIWQEKSWRKKGIVWDSDEFLEEYGSGDDGFTAGGVAKAVVPIICVFVSYNFLKVPIAMATLIGTVIAFVIYFNQFKVGEWVGLFSKGAIAGMVPTLNMSSIAGFGAVMSTSPFFVWLTGWLSTIDANPYVLAMVVTGVLAALLASGTNAVVLSISSLGPMFLGYGEQGYSLGNMHRIMCMSAGILDSIPTNGSIVSLLSIYKCSFKESYSPIFMTCCFMPLLATSVTVILAIIGL